MELHVSKIKEIVEQSGELCEGNCFWKHLTTEYQEELISKRTNLFNFGSKSKHIMEIGFNAGHSCLLFLLSNPSSKIVIFDINEHKYTKPCFEYLDREFPNRMTFITGDSTKTVPQFAREYPYLKFDLIHVDGCHNLDIITQDLKNIRHLVANNHVIISDDDQISHVHKLHRKLVEDKVLQPITHGVLPTKMYTHFVCRFRIGPVLLNEVFAVSEDVHIEKIDDIVIIDNFFRDWTKIRDVFVDAPAFNWKMPEGTRNFIDYYDCRHFYKVHFGFPFQKVIPKIIKHVYGVETRMEDNGVRTNWFKQINPKSSDWSQIHKDWHEIGKEFTVITFLNTEEECSGGTSFFKGLDPIDGHTGMTYWSNLKNYGKPLNIEMKPGRTIIFKSEIPHAAWHPVDSFYDFPRLNIVCRFNP
jgi:hypothetical protein